MIMFIEIEVEILVNDDINDRGDEVLVKIGDIVGGEGFFVDID